MAVEEFSYPARIVTPGKTYETIFMTITGRRTVQQHWSPNHELVMFELQLVGDLDAEVVTYRAITSFNLVPND